MDNMQGIQTNFGIKEDGQEKKFNWLYEEYIEKYLAQRASSLAGEYWIALVGIFETVSEEILDFGLERDIKEKAVLKILKLNEEGKPALEIIANTDEFIDDIIYEYYSKTAKQKRFRLAFAFLLGVFSAMLVKVPTIYYELYQNLGELIEGFSLDFNFYDVGILIAVFSVFSPMTTNLKLSLTKESERAKKIAVSLAINLLIAALVMIICHFIHIGTEFKFQIHIWITLSILLLSAAGLFLLNKKII